MNLEELAQRITPKKTVLFLGSGASVSSGAPTASGLAEHLVKVLANNEGISEDLMEVASILEMRLGRNALIAEIRSTLRSLQPDGALIAMAHLGWPTVFTTNYDELIEQAFRSAKAGVVIVRSNYDYSKLEQADGTPLFKIHGCVSQDLVDGHAARMVISERDYEEYSDYRESLFKRLQLEIVTRDVLIVGHSLRDAHIKRDMAEAARLKKEKGAVGNVYLLLREPDVDRARLYEQKGIFVSFGTLEQLAHVLSSAAETQVVVPPDASGSKQLLTPKQMSCCVDTLVAREASPNAKKMFHGDQASYADIRAGLTFRRNAEDKVLSAIETGSLRFVTVTGVAGVGKTTFARRVLTSLASKGFQCWEWRKDFPFRAVEWLKTDAILREKSLNGALFIDECTDSLRQVNVFASAVSKNERPSLRLILTANRAQWVPRVKAPELFANGRVLTLSSLDHTEIEALVNLLDLQPEIRKFLELGFTTLSRKQKIDRLRMRCSADMFVCLKHIFSFDSLDTILLREYGELSEAQQEIYRRVAFLESAGGLVHRQLILRLVSLSPTVLSSYLSQLEGLVDEYDIRPELGLFGWRTRHNVVARTIARYKYADDNELYGMIRSVIENSNPTVWLELKMLRELCLGEGGISRLANPLSRIELYRCVINCVPGERVPRHRLISTLLDIDSFDEAELELREAIDRARLDPPLQRYKVRLLLYKGQRTRGLQREDRIALLREAEREAQEGIARFRQDKQAYRVYAEVGEAIARETGDKATLDHALHEMQEAMNRLLDPDFADMTRNFLNRR